MLAHATCTSELPTCTDSSKHHVACRMSTCVVLLAIGNGRIVWRIDSYDHRCLVIGFVQVGVRVGGHMCETMRGSELFQTHGRGWWWGDWQFTILLLTSHGRPQMGSRCLICALADTVILAAPSTPSPCDLGAPHVPCNVVARARRTWPFQGVGAR
jgi:hypothetical protein